MRKHFHLILACCGIETAPPTTSPIGCLSTASEMSELTFHSADNSYQQSKALFTGLVILASAFALGFGPRHIFEAALCGKPSLQRHSLVSGPLFLLKPQAFWFVYRFVKRKPHFATVKRMFWSYFSFCLQLFFCRFSEFGAMEDSRYDLEDWNDRYTRNLDVLML